jgi:serine/threonine protein kinase
VDTDRTLRPDERSLVVCPKCGGQTAVLARDASQGQARCNHCTAVLGRELLALGITPPSQGSVSEHPTDIVENHPFGRYLLKKELGRGGMGVVWLAEDPTLGRQVAIKLLSGAGAEDVARFEREARTAASLSHPNIAPIYEVGVQDGRPYLAMQYIKGRTLDQAIVERKVSARAGAEIVRDAARAVHHANESGVIHRDLKPQNIMIQTEDS